MILKEKKIFRKMFKVTEYAALRHILNQITFVALNLHIFVNIEN